MTLNIITHKNILLKILKDIYTDTSLGPLLGFKGGTAAYLFYNLNRFSVDLDFDLLNDSKPSSATSSAKATDVKKATAGREQEVFKKVENIVKGYGTIKEKSNKRYTLLTILSYSAEAQNIKIEINKRSFGSQYEIKNYLGISMLVMKKEDMLAHKLVAMTERNKTANRDIYDVHFFLNNNWEINKKIVEERTEMKFIDYLKKCIEFIENLPGSGILSGMGELLDGKQKVWVKANLKKDILFLLKVMLDNEK